MFHMSHPSEKSQVSSDRVAIGMGDLVIELSDGGIAHFLPLGKEVASLAPDGCSVYLADGKQAVKWCWDTLGNSYNPPLQEAIPHYDAYIDKLVAHALTICLFKQKVLVGAVSLYANDAEGQTAFITQVATSKTYSRQGVGSALMAIVDYVSKSKGMTSIKLEIHVDNIKAYRLYERNGYTSIDRSDRGGIIMVKSLNTECL